MWALEKETPLPAVCGNFSLFFFAVLRSLIYLEYIERQTSFSLLPSLKLRQTSRFLISDKELCFFSGLTTAEAFVLKMGQRSIKEPFLNPF